MDAKDEPGAADFYYGEMEMRRHGRKRNEAERWLLQLYWLLSGYGLRASRALGWLTLAMMTTIVLMMGFGLPQATPKQEVTGIVPPGGGKVTFEIDKDDPQNPMHDRFTTKRFEKALSAHRRFAEWPKARVWAKLHRLVLDEFGSRGELDWSRCAIDSVNVRALKRGN